MIFDTSYTRQSCVMNSIYLVMIYDSASSLSLTNEKKSTFAEQGSFSHNIYFIHPALQWFP